MNECGGQGRHQDETGAIAIIVGLLCVVLLSFAALTVDLGMMLVQKSEVQQDTDQAVLAGAGGNNLPGTPIGTCGYGVRAASSDQAVADVARHFVAESWSPAPSAAELADCDLTNGEALYGTLEKTLAGPVLQYDPNQLTVLSPERTVDFGFAKIMGFDSAAVTGSATAAVSSPSVRSVPFYAFTGCDYGRQTIAQPNNGHANGGPLLSHAGEVNFSVLSGVSTFPATTPPTVALGSDSSLEIAGLNLLLVTDVGFFESGVSGQGPEPITVPRSQFDFSGLLRIKLSSIPSQVTSVPGTWYVRVKIGGNWSAVSLAPQLIVGEPTLTCGQGSSEGNFGSLLLANSQAKGEWQQIAMNIATGLEHSIAVHPSPQDDWTCSSGQSGAVLWPEDGTNCTDTKPGMVANAAHAGLVSGVSGTSGFQAGRLANTEPGTGCADSGAPATSTVSGVLVNNDTLTCFLTDGSTNVGMISSAGYAGGPVLSTKIFASPRFMMVPVLGRQPANGGSAKYQIVGLRPAFLTDQPNSATKTTTALAGNGLTLDKKGEIESVQIVFLNAAALPAMESADVTPYSGSGPRVLRLVD
ncbi:hypothetical protein GCM10027020_01910 [Nocardioides salsibiostraticola]